jgi:hypothetical protein
MIRAKPTKEYVLIAWKDSDVPDQIKDKSFAGKLPPAQANKGKCKKFLLCHVFSDIRQLTSCFYIKKISLVKRPKMIQVH